MTQPTAGNARRPPRVWTVVVTATDVREGDVLSYHGLSGRWEEGTVHSRGREPGHDPCWWVDHSRWSGGIVHVDTVLVERAYNGTLRQVETDRRGPTGRAGR